MLKCHKSGRTKRLIEKNAAKSIISRLRDEGKSVPIELLRKVGWKRKIARGCL